MTKTAEERAKQLKEELDKLEEKDVQFIEAFMAGYTAAKLNSTENQQKAG